jgi:DNA-binding CsgD family transcriptional regulator
VKFTEFVTEERMTVASTFSRRSRAGHGAREPGQAAVLRARCAPASTGCASPISATSTGSSAPCGPRTKLAGGKGRSAHTLEAVERLLASGEADMSAAEVAEQTGMSRATAQRYLSHLHEVGRVEIRLRYGSGGRPEHGYRWARITGR